MASLKAAGKAYIKAKNKGKKSEPGIGNVLLQYWNPNLKVATAMVIKRKGQGYVMMPKSKAGDIPEGDAVLDQLNRLMELNRISIQLEDQVIPKHVYTSKESKVMRSLDEFVAIKTATDEKGWIMGTGQFFSEDVFVRQVLRGIDKLTYGISQGLSLEAMYLSLSPLKRAEMAKRASQIDWDEFFKELYPVETVIDPKTGKMREKKGKPAPLGAQKMLIYKIALQMGIDLGWYDNSPPTVTL